LYAVGELGYNDLVAQLEQAIEHEDENVQFAALWSATRFGSAHAMEKIKQYVSHPTYGDKALQFIVMQKDIKNTSEILRSLYQDDKTKRRSILGLGYIGNPKIISQLIQLMEVPESARIAGDAFSTITGLNLEQSGMIVDAPEEVVAGPSENPDDESVDLDPDADLPWPDAGKIAAWWKNTENQNRFSHADRYFLGQQVNTAQLQNVLRVGNLKQRVFSAICLALYEREKPIFNVFSPSMCQMKLLGNR